MCVRPARLNQKTEVGLTVPCGQCIECRLKRSREWAIRCMQESSLYEVNSFITLTYADEFLPPGGSLDRRAFPLFMKRLRKECGSVRYFHAGEYGERNGRPHYHALLFGLWFPDGVRVGVTSSGFEQLESPTLSALWPQGIAQIGSVTFESAQYVARYCVKKITGSRAEAHYTRVDAQGVSYRLEPEYATMSRRPGIGFGWYEKFREDVYRDDCVMRLGGHAMSVPRFYDKKEFELVPARRDEMQVRRFWKGVTGDPDRGSKRERAAREEIAYAGLARLEEARR